MKTIKEYRKKWLREGDRWFENKEKPVGWDKEKQMQYIPKEYKG